MPCAGPSVLERGAPAGAIRRVACLDLSTWWGGVALVEQIAPGTEPVVVAEIGALVHDSHALHLLSWIERLLAEAGWSRSSLDGFVATRGPGSFTGVRVGLGTIRGLAIASGQPCAAVPTLEAMAQAHGPAGLDRIAVLAAGRGEIFAARYDGPSSPPRALGPPWLGGPASLDDALGATGLLIPARGHEERVRAIAAERGYACAPAVRGVAAAAGWLALVGGAFAEGELAPLYLRPPVVELDRDAD